MIIRVALGNVVIVRGRRFRLGTGRGVSARWMSVVVGSLSGETDVYMTHRSMDFMCRFIVKWSGWWSYVCGVIACVRCLRCRKSLR